MWLLLGGGIVAVLLAGGAPAVPRLTKCPPAALPPLLLQYSPAVPKNGLVRERPSRAQLALICGARPCRPSVGLPYVPRRRGTRSPTAGPRSSCSRCAGRSSACTGWCGCRTAVVSPSSMICDGGGRGVRRARCPRVGAARGRLCSAASTSRRCGRQDVGLDRRSTSAMVGVGVAAAAIVYARDAASELHLRMPPGAARPLVPDGVYVRRGAGRCWSRSPTRSSGDHVPTRRSSRDLLPTAPQTLPFVLLGFLLGRMYLALGPAVMLLIIVPILIAREMFAVVPASEGVARRDRSAAHPRARAEGSRTPPVTRSGSRSTRATSARSSTSCRRAWSACGSRP